MLAHFTMRLRAGAVARGTTTGLRLARRSFSQRSPFEVLGVRYGATEKDVQQAFARKALMVHPDHNKGDPKAALSA